MSLELGHKRMKKKSPLQITINARLHSNCEFTFHNLERDLIASEEKQKDCLPPERCSVVVAVTKK